MKTIGESAREWSRDGEPSAIEQVIAFSSFKAGVEFAQRWIPVTEESPDEHEKVLVKLGTDSIMMGIMDSNNQWGVFWSDGTNGEDVDRPITHWRPIELK